VRFFQDPHSPHSHAIKYPAKYLQGTSDKGIILTPEKTNSIKLYANTDWFGNWRKKHSKVDELTTKSRTGFVLFFAGYPLQRGSNLQNMAALSTTEADYIALSKDLQKIPTISLIHELNDLKKSYVLNNCQSPL